MNLMKSVYFASIALFVSGCANQNFKADEPIDYKEQAKIGYGSLIKDKDSVLRKYFGKDSAKDEITVEKVSTNSKIENLWNSALIALKDFPIEFMDKKSGKIETEKVKVKAFDNTETCTYKIFVTIKNESEVNVVVTSSEDSSVRLQKHAETIKSKILEKYKK